MSQSLWVSHYILFIIELLTGCRQFSTHRRLVVVSSLSCNAQFVDGECCVRLSLSMVEPCRYIRRLCRLVTSSPGSVFFYRFASINNFVWFTLFIGCAVGWSVGRRHVWEWIAVNAFNTSVRRSVRRLCLHLHRPTLFIDQTRAPMNNRQTTIFAKKAKAARNWPLPQSQLTAHEVSSDYLLLGPTCVSRSKFALCRFCCYRLILLLPCDTRTAPTNGRNDIRFIGRMWKCEWDRLGTWRLCAVCTRSRCRVTGDCFCWFRFHRR